MNLRCRRADGEEDASEEELGVHVPRLDEDGQRETDQRVPDRGDPSHTQPIGDQAPGRAGDERNELVSEAERADDVSDAMFLANQVGDNERDGAVEEDEEGDGEERDAEEVGERLQGCDRGRER